MIVGNSTICGGNHAARWTASGGWTTLGFLPGGSRSIAYAANPDGSIVVGSGNYPGGSVQAFRWTASTGIVGLAFLPGGNASHAAHINADGTVMVGLSNDSTGAFQAVPSRRWLEFGVA